MIYVTADMHFGHRNIIDHASRPFASTDEMNRVLTTNWNNIVKPEDTVYIVGDIVGYGKDIEHRANGYVKRLNGDKILLEGNHDRKIKYDTSLFKKKYNKDYCLTLTHNGRLFVLNHKIDNLDIFSPEPDTLYLHGHSHNPKFYNQIMAIKGNPVYDVGVDANDFSPVSLDTIIENISKWQMAGQPEMICPYCGSPIVIREGMYGKFYGCSAWPRTGCKFTCSFQ